MNGTTGCGHHSSPNEVRERSALLSLKAEQKLVLSGQLPLLRAYRGKCSSTPLTSHFLHISYYCNPGEIQRLKAALVASEHCHSLLRHDFGEANHYDGNPYFIITSPLRRVQAVGGFEGSSCRDTAHCRGRTAAHGPSC